MKVDLAYIKMIYRFLPFLFSLDSLFLLNTIMLRNFYASAVLLFSIVCFTSPVNAQTVTLNMTINNVDVGDIVISLFPDDAPISVANFLGYVNRGDYDQTFIHRSIPGFVVQGGSFALNATPVPAQPPILNEFGRSNLRGTVAFARVAGSVNSATSSFFFNIQDSNDALDTVDGGFTVFGEVVSGMDVVDAINNSQTENLNPLDPNDPNNPDPPGPFSDVPFIGSGFFVVIDSATMGPPFALGDVNRDGAVDFLDISPFITVLASSGFQNEADIDRDGSVNFLDISPFITILSTQ